MNQKRVAVIDGHGASAEVSLWLETYDPEGGDLTKELPWPKEWGDWVDQEFLERHGYEVVIA